MVYFYNCIILVVLNALRDWQGFTFGEHYHFFDTMTNLFWFVAIFVGGAYDLETNIIDRLKYIFKLIVIYTAVRFFIFDHLYGFLAHGDFGYLGNSLYEKVIGFLNPIVLILLRSIFFIYAIFQSIWLSNSRV